LSIVDKILKGENAGGLPLQIAERYELVINLKTAKALGLSISEAFLLLADEVIEQPIQPRSHLLRCRSQELMLWTGAPGDRRKVDGASPSR
jgi:hypothetical protein